MSLQTIPVQCTECGHKADCTLVLFRSPRQGESVYGKCDGCDREGALVITLPILAGGDQL